MTVNPFHTNHMTTFLCHVTTSFGNHVISFLQPTVQNSNGRFTTLVILIVLGPKYAHITRLRFKHERVCVYDTRMRYAQKANSFIYELGYCSPIVVILLSVLMAVYTGYSAMLTPSSTKDIKTPNFPLRNHTTCRVSWLKGHGNNLLPQYLRRMLLNVNPFTF